MKKLVFLVFLLSLSFAYSQHLVKPDTLWTYGPANFTSYPAVHPNGNVLVRIGFDVHELNGLTGEFIRKIYIPTDANSGDRIEVSSDGTKLIAGKYYVDYATGELLHELPDFYRVVFLNPRSDIILFAPHWNPDPKGFKMLLFDLKDSSTTEIITEFFPTAINISMDGKYFAIGCQEYEPEERTHFYLYDAQTLKLIDELENVPSTGRRIEFIQFSETAKYVGYGHLSGGYYKSTFFTVQAPYNKWEFTEWIMPGYSMNGVGFINDRYSFLSNCSFDTIHSVIYNIDSGKIINNIDNYGSYLPLYNKENNTIILDQFYSQQNDQPIPILSCFDVNKLITGINPLQEFDSSKPISVIYNNGNIIIDNLPTSDSIVIIKIYDLEGRIIYSAPPKISSSKTIINLLLGHGVYILQIDCKGILYSQKFIISN